MKKIKKRKKSNDICAALGQYVLEYILYIESGYDAYKALVMLGKREDDSIPGSVIGESLNMMQSGMTLSKALSIVSGRYYEENLDSFIRIIIRGYTKGEDQMSQNLGLLAGKILHDEVSAVREKAERASSQLSFPVALIFIAIVIIAVYPALAQIKI